MLIIFIILLVFLLLAFIAFVKGIPYLVNHNCVHQQYVHVRVFYSEVIGGYIHFRFETIDDVIVGNPINIIVRTGILSNINTLQLTFDGASKYFPSDPKTSEEFDDLMAKAIYNILPLERKVAPITGFIHFEGSLNGLVYGASGIHQVGITFTKADHKVQGFETGDREKKISEAIQVAPRTTLLSIRNNNIMTGLTWIITCLTFLAVSIPIIIFIVQPTEEQNTESIEVYKYGYKPIYN